MGLSCTRVPSGYCWLLLRCWASGLSPRLIRLVLPRVTWGTRGDVNTERGASSLHPPVAAGQRCERPAGRVAGNARPRSNRRPVGQLSRNTENIPRPGGSVLESPAAGGRPPPSVRDSVLATQGSALASCR